MKKKHSSDQDINPEVGFQHPPQFKKETDRKYQGEEVDAGANFSLPILKSTNPNSGTQKHLKMDMNMKFG